MSNKNDNPAMSRIARFVDENSFMEIGAAITARSTDFNLGQTDTPSDGVITGYGLVDGNLVFVYSQDVSVLGGTIGEMHAKKIANVYDMAMKMGAPVVGFIDCAGIRLQESVDALEGFGQIYQKQVKASGIIPQVSAIFGTCGGGLSVVPALCDFTYAEKENAKIFINSPNAIDGNRIDKCDTSAASYQSEETGNIDALGTEEEILAQIRNLICMLPSNNAQEGCVDACTDDLNRGCVSLDVMKGDPHYILSEISDNHNFLETKQDYAKEMVTGFIKLNGMTVGAIANCTEVYDEKGEKTAEYDAVLSARGCDKAAEFVSFCDAFDIPVLSLTNAVGFQATMCEEKNLAKAVGRLVFALSNATVPKVNLITDKAYGSAYVIMNSKSLSADLVYAWPDASTGMMDAKLAAKIMYDGEDSSVIDEKAEEYEALQGSVSAAARRGYVDRMIDYPDTRKYLIAAFEMLYTKSTEQPYKKHGTR